MPKDRQYINAEINTRAADNSSNDITAEDLRVLLLALNDSAYNRVEDKLGLLRWQSGRAYAKDELTFRAGAFYVSLADGNTGNVPESSAAFWSEITTGSSTPPALTLWDTQTSYTAGTYVEHQGQFYRALVDNQGFPPDTSPNEWLPIGVPEGFGAPYEPGLFVEQGQVLRYNNRLWEAQADFETASFATEEAAGQWVEISPASNAATYRGTRWRIPQGVTETVALDHQWVVRAPIQVAGTFNIEGQLVLL